MHGIVERKTLYFPGPSLVSGVFKACGVPGPAASGGAMFPTVDPTGSTYVNTAQQAYQRMDLPPDVHAIGIAPDSAIHSCDVAIAGQDGELHRHRISPGNPLLGCRAGDHVFVSIPNSLRCFANSGNSVFHDSPVVGILDSAGIQGWPLRLELYRGEAAPIRSHRRALYIAHAVFADVDTAENGGVRELVVCVDGRNRIDVQIYVGAVAGVTLALLASEARKTPSNGPTNDMPCYVPLPMTDAGATSVAHAVTDTMTLYSLVGNPISVLVARITCATNNSDVQLRVLAWDD